jgi:hypothetical protein
MISAEATHYRGTIAISTSPTQNAAFPKEGGVLI